MRIAIVNDLALAREEDHLPVEDAARDALAHRQACGRHLIVLRLTRLVRRGAPGIHQEADSHAALRGGHERVQVARVRHHPERHVDPDRFLLDVGQDVGAAVLERGIAQPLLACERLSG